MLNVSVALTVRLGLEWLSKEMSECLSKSFRFGKERRMSYTKSSKILSTVNHWKILVRYLARFREFFEDPCWGKISQPNLLPILVCVSFLVTAHFGIGASARNIHGPVLLS